MTDDLGWVELGVKPDGKSFPGDLSRQISPGIDAEGSRIGSRFSAGFKKAAIRGSIGLAAGLVGAIKLGGDAISAASDLAESQNKVQQVFGKSADSIFKFTEKTADAYGQTNQQARDAAATFGIFGHAADLNDKKTAKFAIRMDKLASDLASFHNTSPEQAIEAIGAALRGESEPIRSYGVLLDDATLKAKALSLGLLEPVKNQSQIKSAQAAVIDGQKKYNDAVDEYGSKSLEALKADAALGTARDRLKKATDGTIPALTQQQKVLAAQASILDQTKVAQGDFARTSDGLANSQRRLSARWEDAKAKLGTALLPVMQDFVGFLLKKGIPAVEDFSDWARDDGAPMIKKVGDFLGDASGHAKDLIGFLKDLPDPAKYAGLATLLTGGAALKLRGGSGGALGSAGSALGLTRPVNVFVTNPGFGSKVSGPGGGGTGRGPGALAFATIPRLNADGERAALDNKFRDLSKNGSGIEGMIKRLVAANEEWGTFEFNSMAAFRAVDKAIEHSTPLMVRYNRVLDGTPREVKTWLEIPNYAEAMQQIKTFRAGIDGIAERGLDNGVPYVHGGQRSAPTVHIEHAHINDGRDLLKKSQQASLGGRPW